MHFAFLFPRFKLLSGAERLILKLSEALIENGEEVSILCHQFDPSCRAILPSGAKLLVSGSRLDFFKNRYANAMFDYFKAGSLLNLLSSSVDAVCCFGPALTVIPRIKKKLKVPVLYFCYEPPRFLYTDRDLIQERLGLAGLVSGPLFAFYRQRDRKLVRSVDRILSTSEFSRTQIREIYGYDAKILTPGLDLYRPGTKRSQLRVKLGLSEGDVAVITVNYLHPRKRINLFLDTLEIVRRSNPAVKGVIVGEGPEMERLRNRAGFGMRFTGFVKEDDFFEYFQAADIYLHTARLETFGLSVIEAAGNRLPVVSVNEGGPLETMIDGETGLLRESSPEQLAEAVSKLAADPALREKLGTRGYEYVRTKYSWQKGAADFLEAVHDLM